MPDNEGQLIEVTRWNFLIEEGLGISGLPPEAWVEMFMTPLTSLGGHSVCDVLRKQLGLDPIED